MAREITISASTRPVCSSFFKIREQDSEYQSMEEFTYTHSEIDNSLLQTSLDKGTQRKTTENELPSLTQCTA